MVVHDNVYFFYHKWLTIREVIVFTWSSRPVIMSEKQSLAHMGDVHERCKDWKILEMKRMVFYFFFIRFKWIFSMSCSERGGRSGSDPGVRTYFRKIPDLKILKSRVSIHINPESRTWIIKPRHPKLKIGKSLGPTNPLLTWASEIAKCIRPTSETKMARIRQKIITQISEKSVKLWKKLYKQSSIF